MRRSWAPLAVGALALAIAISSYVLIRSTKEGTPKSEGYAVWALFRDATGLWEKSRVQTAGIIVGQIEARELDQKTAKAKVTIRIMPGIKLWSNAVITKKSASLLGEFFLEIDPGTPVAIVDGVRTEMTLLKDGDQLKNVREPLGVGDIMNEVGTLMPILQDILRDVRNLTSGTITDIAENVNTMIATDSEILERLLRRMDNIARTVEGVTNSEADDVKIAIRNVREITESIKGLVGSTGGEVSKTGTEVRNTLEKLQTTVASLERTMKNVESISGKVNSGEGTLGQLVNNDTIARNVEEITDEAGGFIRSITKMQTIVGLRTEYSFLAGTFKNYVQVTLAPRPDKFYLIEIVDDPRGFREETVTSTSNSATSATVTEKKVTISQKLRFTFQFGKRVGPVTGRFGIKESTGGFGLDVHLFDDRLTLSTDIFDTRANINPRVQARAFYALYQRNLFLVAGLDDLANLRPASAAGGGGLDWFLGAQLTFNDEDLKSFLVVGGSSAMSGAGSK